VSWSSHHSSIMNHQRMMGSLRQKSCMSQSGQEETSDGIANTRLSKRVIINNVYYSTLAVLKSRRHGIPNATVPFLSTVKCQMRMRRPQGGNSSARARRKSPRQICWIDKKGPGCTATASAMGDPKNFSPCQHTPHYSYTSAGKRLLYQPSCENQCDEVPKYAHAPVTEG
jgi:hypothetical protein